MKQSLVIKLFPVIEGAKVGSVSEVSEKVVILKILKELRPVVSSFEDFKKNAQKKAEGEGHDNFVEQAKEWQANPEEFNKKTSDEERAAINKYFSEYQNRYEEMIAEEESAEVELKNKIKKETFEQLIQSNPEWGLKEIELISEIPTE